MKHNSMETNLKFETISNLLSGLFHLPILPIELLEWYGNVTKNTNTYLKMFVTYAFTTSTLQLIWSALGIINSVFDTNN